VDDDTGNIKIGLAYDTGNIRVGLGSDRESHRSVRSSLVVSSCSKHDLTKHISITPVTFSNLHSQK